MASMMINIFISMVEPYIEKLNKVGIVDITTAERADIVDAF